MNYDAFETHGLIFASTVARFTDDRRSLSRDESRGLLIAVRRGVFVRRDLWEASSAREQHVLRVRAAVASADRPVVVAGVSAAAMWQMPISAAWPTDVMLLEERRGGGHIEPGVRRTSVGALSAQPTMVNGVLATSLARTALDVARNVSFAEGIGSLDWARWRRNPAAISAAGLGDELALLHPHRGFRHLARQVDFSTDLSDSFGESRSRATIHLLGFHEPQLQVEFWDAEGKIVPDFFWRGVREAGEFDGKIKYTRNEFTNGDPSEAVWQEKRREDRLRRMVGGVLRFVNDDVRRPERLERILLVAGVPRYQRLGGRR